VRYGEVKYEAEMDVIMDVIAHYDLLVDLRYAGDNDELYFRDYLIEFPDMAKEYEKLKISLWKKYEHNRDAYTNAKTEFVKKYTEKAKVLYGNRY